jgi:hypothetical protein
MVTDYPKGEQRPHKFKIAMAIFAVTMLLALVDRIPVSIALMTGVVGMLLSGVLTIDEAYASISWRTVFLMAALIPLGWAVDSTGAARVGRRQCLGRFFPQATPVACSRRGRGAHDPVRSDDRPRRVDDRDGAAGDQPCACGRRQSDRVRARRGAGRLQQHHDRFQSGDLDDQRPWRIQLEEPVAHRFTAVLVYLAVMLVAVNLLF